MLSQGSILAKAMTNYIVVSIDSKKSNHGFTNQNSSDDIFTDTRCTIFDTTQLPNSKHKRHVNVDALHVLLGHPPKATTRLMAKEIDVKMTGIFPPCEACALGKAKKVNISKTINKRSNHPR